MKKLSNQIWQSLLSATVATIILLGLADLSFAQNGEAVSGGIVNEKAVKLPSPAYPPAARAVHASGEVNVKVMIDETGKVISAEAVSGHPLLKMAAETAAKQAEFKPTMLNKKAVKVTGILTYNFVLDTKSNGSPPNDKQSAGKSEDSSKKDESEQKAEKDSETKDAGTLNSAGANSSGQKLEGRYKSSRGMLYYTFQLDGTFVKATAGGTSDSAYGTTRPGTYNIEGSTITLKFSDGATDQYSFEILDNKDLKINGLTFWVWNS